ncbi:flavodoxin [Enterococcus sp. BWT-B8]|uniref:flavodoxin n=1 Tax=Enterococcus sp. BWT-B8 TaxID=2885157 RepID=UPI001E5FD1BC|nr:flavodoxin [Enterococcus sp. BWT-B8]MCB5953367.1 flavodoxin [Enterococcus sp. BWT-B8]
MKKLTVSTLLILVTLVISGCKSDQASTPREPLESTVSQNERSKSNSLVVYFTVPEASGTDTVAGASRVVNDGEVLGNTQQIAQWISEATNSDTFEVITEEAYPADHDELVDQAEDELETNVRPTVSSQIENLSNYDTIFIGYPIWWSDLPKPMYSFFDEVDFSGKKIIPFSTHGGSGFSRTITTITDLEPDAQVKLNEGLTISRNDIADSQETVIDWLNSLELSNE